MSEQIDGSTAHDWSMAMNQQPATPASTPRVGGLFAPFGLAGDPFPRDPLAGVWVALPSHQQAFDLIHAWLMSGDPGFAFVSGAPGSGKTRLLDRLVHATIDAGDEERLVGIAPGDGGRRSDAQLLRETVVALGGTPSGRTGLELTSEIRALVEHHRDDAQTPVLFIDQAALTGSQLELLRAMLTTDAGDARVQIVLFGPPVMPDRIKRRRSLAALLRCDVALPPLDAGELGLLFEARIAGVRTPDANVAHIVAQDAFDLIVDRSGGLPGPALAIAHAAMREAIATGSARLEVAHITESAARGDAGEDEVIQTRMRLPGLDDAGSERRRRQQQ